MISNKLKTNLLNVKNFREDNQEYKTNMKIYLIIYEKYLLRVEDKISMKVLTQNRGHQWILL